MPARGNEPRGLVRRRRDGARGANSLFGTASNVEPAGVGRGGGGRAVRPVRRQLYSAAGVDLRLAMKAVVDAMANAYFWAETSFEDRHSVLAS